MRNGSIKHYNKIITFILILATIPVIIVGLFSYLRSSEIIQNNVAKEKEQSIYQIQTNVEQVLKTVDHSLTYFVSTTHLHQILREPLTPIQFQLYRQAKRELSGLQTKETGVEDIILISLQENWAINNSGLQRLTEDEKDEIFKKYITEPQGASWVLEQNSTAIFNSRSNYSCPYHINLVKNMPFTSSNKIGIALARIPVCSFNNIMNQQLETEETIIVDENFNIVGHQNSEEIGRELLESNKIAPIVTENKIGQFDMEINEIGYKITYRKSEYNDWTYISAIKLKDLQAQSRSIGLFTIIICTFLLVLSFTISLIGTRKFYRPIQQLHELITTKINHKPEHDHRNEFDLIEKKIEHMLDQNNQLEQKLQGQITQLKQFFMVKLLQGKISETELPEKISSFSYTKVWKRLVVFTVQIDTLEDSQYNVKEEDLLLFAINTMMHDLLPENDRFTPIVMNRTQVTVVISQHETEEEYTTYINQFAQHAQKVIKEELNIPVSIGISLPFESLIFTKEAYRESVEALKYRIKFEKEAIIFFENLERGNSFHTHFPKHIENEIFDNIKIGNREKVDSELNKFLKEILNKNVSHTQYQVSVVRFLNDLLELTQTLGIDILDNNYNLSMLETLNSLKTLEELEEWFKEVIIYPLMSKVEERTNSQYKNLSDKIIHIIQEEFDTDITLESIATKLHYNPNYLSSIFKKETNMSFSEYLSLYRHNTAKKLLVETEMSVKEIAEKLKYTNSQNFIRSFKKNEGTTPGKFRDLKKAQ